MSHSRKALLVYPFAVLACAAAVHAQETVSTETVSAQPTSELEGPPRWIDGVASLLPLPDDLETGILLRAFWGHTDDDISGFGFHDIDVWGQMKVDEFDFRVGFDAGDGTAELEDAYVLWKYSDALFVKGGNFKPDLLFSNSFDPDRLLFNDRTILGTFFDQWDVGAQVCGTVIDKLDYAVSLTNGADGLSDESLVVLRGEYSIYGEDMPRQEGVRGSTGKKDVRVGVSFFEGTGTDDAGIGVDAQAQFDRSMLLFEFMDLDNGVSGDVDLSLPIDVAIDGNSNPWALTASHLFNDKVQGAVRFQSLDNTEDTTVWGGAVQYYPVDGPFSLVFEFQHYDNENASSELVFQIGVNIGNWRPR